MTERVRMIGLKEFGITVSEIKSRVTGEMLAKVGEAGLTLVQNAAKQKAPFRTGTLRRSIHIEVTRIGAKNAELTVGTGKEIPYAAIQEFGGVITPKKAKMLSWIDRDSGERIFAKSVTIPARPYMRPAWDENINAVIDTIGKLLRKAVQRGK